MGRHKAPHQLHIFVVDGNFRVLAEVTLPGFGTGFLWSFTHHSCLFIIFLSHLGEDGPTRIGPGEAGSKVVEVHLKWNVFNRYLIAVWFCWLCWSSRRGRLLLHSWKFFRRRRLFFLLWRALRACLSRAVEHYKVVGSNFCALPLTAVCRVPRPGLQA